MEAQPNKKDRITSYTIEYNKTFILLHKIRIYNEGGCDYIEWKWSAYTGASELNYSSREEAITAAQCSIDKMKRFNSYERDDEGGVPSWLLNDIV